MNLIEEYNKQLARQKHIVGVAMKVFNKYHGGLLESAYECALKYLLVQDGYKVEVQKELPMYWDDVRLDKTYRMDLVVDDDIIIELKALKYIKDEQRKQLKNYMVLTHTRWGMLINFSMDRVYSEWYRLDANGSIEQVRLF
ncbi:GxxExxY protein [Prevotella sp. P5-126]|uniref:GxxExxY protein n=1 Tax=unclassified Prevotella TaxID=2638335 RepID=UPI000B966752|nr:MULTISPECIES: GxxExxY protein [unclassified Prevotella]MDO5305216.1 GxxExxY protein [bacterium]OYP41030.1 GxxExxY protein [Prevotella sp. P5-126]OYP45872.1 GxxExxY protein [Prevotella sp. P4-119]